MQATHVGRKGNATDHLQLHHLLDCALLHVLCCLQEEAIRELSAALQAKDEELSDARKQAAAEADAAVLQRMQVRPYDTQLLPDNRTASPCPCVASCLDQS